jgi:serine/threonine protein kinase
MAVEVGQLFGNYRMVRLLGEGGFGEVYLVENPLIQRRAAVKVLHTALAQDVELVRRFLNEARAASAIRHPNIIDVLDAGGMPDGAPYILMEFLEGESLQKRLADRGRLALPQVLDIATQVGSALAAAHAANIVHRDLKPENLFLVPDKNAPTGEKVKILDFGIAKIKQGSRSGETVKTQTGIIMGSPAYMSPEQCKDSADVDLRSDVYSFATILYEMLAGRTPHVAETGTEMLVMHLTATPPSLHELVAEVPANVEAAIMRGLACARDDRFDDIPSFVEALQGNGARSERILPEPAKARPVTLATPEVRAERSAALPSATTFSRATGEVSAADDDESLSVPTRRWRWLPFVIGGVALACVGLFLSMPSRSHESVRLASPVAEPARAVEPIRQETLSPTPPAVVPIKPDALTQPTIPSAAVPLAATTPLFRREGKRKDTINAPRGSAPSRASAPKTAAPETDEKTVEPLLHDAVQPVQHQPAKPRSKEEQWRVD